MRRTDREVTDRAQQLEILQRCEVCRIGFAVDGEAYIVPLNFGYEVADEQLFLYFHCATEGRKLDMMAANPRVCFEMDCGHRLIDGERACDFSYAYESIMGQGLIEQITADDGKRQAFQQLMDKYRPGRVWDFEQRNLDRTCVLKLTVQSLSAKRSQR